MSPPKKSFELIRKEIDRQILVNLKIHADFVAEWNAMFINNYFFNDEMLCDSYKGWDRRRN